MKSSGQTPAQRRSARDNVGDGLADKLIVEKAARAALEAELQELREEVEIERLAIQAEHHALAEAQRYTERIRAGYQELYDFGLIGLAMFDSKGTIQNLNPTAAALLGRTVTHLLGRPMLAMVAARDRRKWFRYVREVLQSDGEVKTELHFQRSDRPETVLEFTAILQRAPMKEDTRIRVAFRDVTEQRSAEAAAGAAQEELKFVADCAPVMIARCGRDLRYKFVNEAFAELLQLPKDQIVGRPIAEVIGEKAFKAIRPYVDRVLRGERVDYELEVPYKRVGVHFMHVNCRPEKDNRGQVRGWLAAITDITERRRGELALRESEARFRTMADSAPVLIWISGPDKLYTYFNKPWLNFTGRTLEQELGQGWAEGAHPEDLERCLDTYTRAFERRKEFKREYRLRRHDGHYRWVLDHGVPRFAGKGEFLGYIGSCMDVTDHKEAEQAILDARDVLEERVQERTGELQAEVMIRRQAERVSARLAAIVESSSDAIVSYNLEGKVTSWNDGAARLYGYKQEEMLGQSIARLIPAHLAGQLSRSINGIHRRKELESFETVRLAKDGRRIDVFLRNSPIKGEGGRIVGVSHVARDISARKLAEEALRESEARLQAITDNCPALIFLKDPQGRYLHVNRRFGEVFGMDVRKVAGKTDAQLFPARQAAIYRANDLKVMKAGAPMDFDEGAEHRDGPHVSLVTKFPLFDGLGQIYALGGVATDQTERRRLEKEVLRISDREQQRIAQDLHDSVGQQLAGLCFMSDVLRKNLSANGSPESINANTIARLLHKTIAQTRRLARGLHPVNQEANGLMAALRSLADGVNELFKARCTLRCPEPVLFQDNEAATHLYRIAQEAVTNAVRHGRARRIDIVLSSTARNVKLAVRDDGIGIGQKKRRREGMGLRIMDYRAQMIGGAIEIGARSVGGTEVLCRLPKE